MAAIIRLANASSADHTRVAGQTLRETLMKIRSYASVITLGIGVLQLTTSPVYGQDATPGNALNPRTVSSIVERDPEGLGIAVNSRTPTGLLIPPAPLVKEPSKTSSGMLYRGSVEFGAIGVGGDKGAAKFREYKDLESGLYLNNFTFMLEQPKSAFHLDAVGGGVAQNDQVLRRGRGSIQHVESARLFQRNTARVHVDLPLVVGRRRQRHAYAARTSPGRHDRCEYDTGEHAPRDLVDSGL